MDAPTFLGIEPVDDELHWRLEVRKELTTPGNFLFGGCGLSAGVVALEGATRRPTIWATAQYLSYAPVGSVLDLEVTLPMAGKRVTQGRAVARVGDREILTVNAALGSTELDLGGVWVEAPSVPPPEKCPPRELPKAFADTILDAVDVRVARGRRFEDIPGQPGEPDSALWARLPGHLEPSAGMLAVFGDYVSGATSQPLGVRTMGRSLDNTLRIVQLASTEWVLCDIRLHALVGGYAQGIAFLWSETGDLLATASQSMAIRLWPDDLPVPE